jgi:dTDP-4-dehydrorhamnose 3,5-epimerase
MGTKLLDQIEVTPLKRIQTLGGDILKALMRNEDSYNEFGEAYFSEVMPGAVKAWKFHRSMTLNLVVPKGKVKFVFCDENNGTTMFREEEIGDHRYARITVRPGVWFGFKGIDEQTSIVLNIANILHDPNEVDRRAIEEINYNWK